jgi:dihydroceramide fatty acyl 2-hydroxylase
MMQASDVSPRMFENDFADFFSRTPWYLVPVVWVPISAGVAYAALAKGLSILAFVALFASGLFLWTLAEYWLHREVFHWVPNTWWGPKFHFILHGVHHEWVQDPYRLVMPPVAAVIIAMPFFAAFEAAGAALWALAGVPMGWELALFAGFALGYCVYDCTHYFLHHARFTSRTFKRLKAHHMNHHHNKDGRKFGVSNTFWDTVFGTH